MLVRLITVATISTLCAVSSAQYFSQDFEDSRRWQNLRVYYGYPYTYSTGLRYDPYWSYNASYFPETYYGGGSYYGIGYSGYSGNGWYGSYYYW